MNEDKPEHETFNLKTPCSGPNLAATMKRLAEVFAQERSRLVGQRDRGDNLSTEDLRLALQRYRSFFQSLLSI